MLPFPFTLNWMDLLAFIFLIMAAGAVLFEVGAWLYGRVRPSKRPADLKKAA